MALATTPRSWVVLKPAICSQPKNQSCRQGLSSEVIHGCRGRVSISGLSIESNSIS